MKSKLIPSLQKDKLLVLEERVARLEGNQTDLTICIGIIAIVMAAFAFWG